jgi:hypothetical protein
MFPALISIRGWVYPQGLVRPEELGEFEISPLQVSNSRPSAL